MNDMPTDPLIREILALRELPVSALRERYLAVFGEESTSRNKDYLFKRIAYRMQSSATAGSRRGRRPAPPSSRTRHPCADVRRGAWRA